MAITNATILMRRGNYVDFDPTKMTAGEWAVSIDADSSKRIVWMCFSAGVVKRIGTYEDLSADMQEQLEPYIARFDEQLAICTTKASEAKANADSAKASADSAASSKNAAASSASAASSSAGAASASETNAKASEGKSKASEMNAASSAQAASNSAGAAAGSAQAAYGSAEVARAAADELSGSVAAIATIGTELTKQSKRIDGIESRVGVNEQNIAALQTDMNAAENETTQLNAFSLDFRKEMYLSISSNSFKSRAGDIITTRAGETVTYLPVSNKEVFA